MFHLCDPCFSRKLGHIIAALCASPRLLLVHLNHYLHIFRVGVWPYSVDLAATIATVTFLHNVVSPPVMTSFLARLNMSPEGWNWEYSSSDQMVEVNILVRKVATVLSYVFSDAMCILKTNGNEARQSIPCSSVLV